MYSVFQKGRNLLSYFSPKIKEFDRDTSTGVYRIPCDDCSQCHIGETKEHWHYESILFKYEVKCFAQQVFQEETVLMV